MQDVDFPSSTPAVREGSGDKDCARVLQAVLAVVMRERTTIVIAHRLATAQRADRIFVLDHGRIVDAGTRAELIVRDGRYARLAALQFAA